MATSHFVGEIDNLAAIRPGEEFEIVRSLLEIGEQRHRFVPGKRWSCRYTGDTIILLVNHMGQTISVRRDVARYIEVQRTRPRSR
ncbi:MAG TPA: hypothetical protein VK933_11465 [Longimicrobiales bacterium]|nr:hypothetical protein [Longimicrobiales bacterium]